MSLYNDLNSVLTPYANKIKQNEANVRLALSLEGGGAPVVVSSASDMTDTDKIYVLSTDGKWYYYNGSAWVSGGTYGAVVTDTTLTQTGIPADAKVAGDAIAELNDEISGIEVQISEEIVVEFQNTAKILIANASDRYYGKMYSTSSAPDNEASGFISVEGYESIDITMPKTVNASNAGIVFYSDNVSGNIPSNCITGYTYNYGAESITSEVRHFEIPTGAKYFRTTFLTDLEVEFSCIGHYTEATGGLSDLKEDVVQLQSDVSQAHSNIGNIISLNTNIKTDLVSAINEVNNKADFSSIEMSEPINVSFVQTLKGIIANSSDSKYGKTYSSSSLTTTEYSNFIDIQKYSSIDITMPKTVNASNFGIVFYSDNLSGNIPSNCITGYTYNYGAESITSEVRHFEIPTGAKYFRTTFLTDLEVEFSCIGYYTVETNITDMFSRITESQSKISEIESLLNDTDVAVRVSDFDDGVMDDDAIISTALDFVGNFENRIIIFDERQWNISEAIILDSNTTVYIDGVKIKQNDLTFDNVFRGKNFVVDSNNPNLFALSCGETSNIKIIGLNGASIEGPDVNATIYNPYLQADHEMVGDEYGWRAFQIYICNCDGFEISGLTITKTRNWAMSFEFATNGYIHNLVFDTTGVKNGDGIDLRIGCNNIRIDNISGFTKDDTVACSALYPSYNNASYPSSTSDSMFPCVASRTGQSLENVDQRLLDVHDITVTNCYTGGNEHGAICLCNNGLRVYNVGIYNFNEGSNSTRESVVKLYNGYSSNWHSGSYVSGDLHNISVGNIVANGATYALQITPRVRNVYGNKLIQSATGGQSYVVSYPDGVTITNA